MFLKGRLQTDPKDPENNGRALRYIAMVIADPGAMHMALYDADTGQIIDWYRCHPARRDPLTLPSVKGHLRRKQVVLPS